MPEMFWQHCCRTSFVSEWVCGKKPDLFIIEILPHAPWKNHCDNNGGLAGFISCTVLLLFQPAKCFTAPTPQQVCQLGRAASNMGAWLGKKGWSNNTMVRTWQWFFSKLRSERCLIKILTKKGGYARPCGNIEKSFIPLMIDCEFFMVRSG